MATRINNVFVISKDVVKVTFTQNLAVDRNYLLASNYQITPSSGVIVEKIVRPSGRSVTAVVLLVRGLSSGSTYTINLAAGALREIDGTPTVDLEYTWTHRRTKVDLAVNSVPDSYNTYAFDRGVLRGLIEAMMISDEEIGGDY